MPIIDLADIKTKERVPGFSGTIISAVGTIHFQVMAEENAVLPEHTQAYRHEMHLHAGTFVLTVGD
jgi:hypothetical protein